MESLVIQHNVSGKPAHDARLVTAMRAHGLTAILTLTLPPQSAAIPKINNVRYSAYGNSEEYFP